MNFSIHPPGFDYSAIEDVDHEADTLDDPADEEISLADVYWRIMREREKSGPDGGSRTHMGTVANDV